MIVAVVIALALLFAISFTFDWRTWAKVFLGTLAVCAIVAAIVIPNFVRARTTTIGTPKGICLNAHLRNIQGSKEQWALEHNKSKDAEPTLDEVARYMPKGKMPVCGQRGIYRIGKVGEKPSCSKHGTYED